MTHNFKRRIYIVVSEVHFGPRAHHIAQLIFPFELHLTGLVEEVIRVGQLIISLVKVRKSYPNLRCFTICGLLCIHGLYGLSKGLDRQKSVPFAKFNSIEPFGHIVLILTQNNI